MSDSNSVPRDGAHPLNDKMPDPAVFDRFDKVVIICLIALFLFLLIWFSTTGDQPLFAYWAFTALLTLIFVGVLRAAGIIRAPWIALGGSVTIYIGLLWFTGKTFDNYYDLKRQIVSLESKLQSSDPAKVTLQQYFDLLQAKHFEEAYALVSNARKQERKANLPPDADDLKQFESTFAGTRGYKDFTYEFDKQIGENRSYKVEYDVWIQVPHSTIFETRTKMLSSLSGSVTRDQIASIITDNVKEYYSVPDQALSVIQDYVASRTVDDLMDPIFIAGLVGYLRDVQKLRLEPRPTQPGFKDVWRHFKHDILMIRETAEWKIRSGLNNPVIALYP